MPRILYWLGIGAAVAAISGLMLSLHHHGDQVYDDALNQAPLPPVQVETYDEAESIVTEIVAKEGARPALDMLRRIAEGNTSLAGECHGLAHIIGHDALGKYGFEEALTFEDDICGSGYLHGVIESHFAKTDEEDVPALFANTCAPQSGKCFHGLGHGVMDVYDNDIDRSLALCHSLTQIFQQIQCAEGVFMEHFASDGTGHPSPLLTPDDPYQACRTRRDADRGVCAFYAPRYFLRLHPGAYDDALRWCDTIDVDSRPACLKGVGSAAMKVHVAEPKVAIAACATLEGEDYTLCMEGLVSYRIVHFASTQAGREFCRLLPHDDERACERISEQSEAFYGE